MYDLCEVLMDPPNKCLDDNPTNVKEPSCFDDPASGKDDNCFSSVVKANYHLNFVGKINTTEITRTLFYM